MPPRILITPGEPAGIGPELVARLAMERQAVELVAVADPRLLRQRAEMLDLPLIGHRAGAESVINDAGIPFSGHTEFSPNSRARRSR
jgi:4-hydroxy-L-threonine phosphate dehydrogenase PdxA